MGGILFIFYAGLFAYLILTLPYFKLEGIPRRYLLLVFALKLASGFLLSFLYSEHYTDRKTGDTYRFFDDASVIHSSLSEDPGAYLKLMTGIGIREDETALSYYRTMTHMERPYDTGFFNDNQTIIRANALVMLFSFGHYYVHVAFWCFFAMIGLTAILSVLVRYFPRKRVAMFFAVFLLPTVLFWGSGVLKEPILLLGLGLFFKAFMRFIYGEFKPKNTVALLLGALLLVVTKGYVLYALLPAVFSLLAVKIFKGKYFWPVFIAPHILLIPLVYFGHLLHPELAISEKMRLKQEAFINVASESDAGSLIEIPPVETPGDILRNAPEALLTTYFRPFPWNWSKLLYIPAALENLFLIVALIIMAWNFRRPYGLALPIIAFGLSFTLILGILTGEVVPVLGAVVRYKLPSLIFLFVVIFALTDHIKFQRRFPAVRRILRKL